MSDAALSDVPDNDDTIVMPSVSPHQRLDPDGPPPFAPEPQPAQPAQPAPAPAHELSSEQQMRMNALTFALNSVRTKPFGGSPPVGDALRMATWVIHGVDPEDIRYDNDATNDIYRLSRFLTTEIGEQLRSGETTVDTAIRLLRAWSPGPGPDADGG
jgi:hypothetical protein